MAIVSVSFFVLDIFRDMGYLEGPTLISITVAAVPDFQAEV
jgi:hypothetical protein